MPPDSAPDFAAESHRRHQELWRGLMTEEWAKSSLAHLREETVNGWRRNRFFQKLDPLLAHCPGSSWLTVGDGRFGTDAHYLLAHGVEAHATDVTDAVLQESMIAEGPEALEVADADPAAGAGKPEPEFVLAEALIQFRATRSTTV